MMTARPKALLLALLAIGLGCATGVIQRNGKGSNAGLKVVPRRSHLLEVTLDDRKDCAGGQPVGTQPSNRHDTAERVNNLMVGMAGRGYIAYIVPSSDAHQSEYVAAADKRKGYISGFTGSAGTAVVLSDGQRALWTDGRYFLQADDQLDCNWLFMKDEEPGVPTISEWLISQLAPGDMVSADARLIGADTWLEFEAALSANGISLVVDTIIDGNNLLDDNWNDDGRPEYSLDPIFSLELQFTGREWYDKISDIESQMSSYGADVFVLSSLDEVAWTLNLRGSDIAFNPLFRSYVIIDRSRSGAAQVSLFVPDIDVKVPREVNQTLGVGDCAPGRPCVSLVPYNDIETQLSSIAAQSSVSKVMIAKQFSTSSGASYYIYNLIPSKKRMEEASPVLLMKASKNEVEKAGMRNAHVKDAVALISFLAFMESEIASGAYWTELTSQHVLAGYRYEQKDNMGLSFTTISGFGSNGAIIHYSVTEETDTQITDQNLYLLDSGGQYKDGTTDVTRTLHYGTPTPHQIEAYTRVLLGVIDFGTVIFPKGYGKYATDILARRNLYSAGLDYRHGTSHGVGSFLNVHEASDIVYEIGFHGSDEPGYYEDGEWGIRIENVIAVVNVTTQYNFVEESYGIDTITLVPMEPKLIDVSLMTEQQCEFLNSYNMNIRQIVGPELRNQFRDSAYDWMLTKTEPITCV